MLNYEYPFDQCKLSNEISGICEKTLEELGIQVIENSEK